MTPRTESTYVVQRESQFESQPVAWVDIATVTVPARTKMRTVIQKAMEAMQENGKARLRVLDADAAHVHTVEWEQPPPRLVVDGPPDMG